MEAIRTSLNSLGSMEKYGKRSRIDPRTLLQFSGIMLQYVVYTCAVLEQGFWEISLFYTLLTQSIILFEQY